MKIGHEDWICIKLECLDENPWALEAMWQYEIHIGPWAWPMLAILSLMIGIQLCR